MVSDSVNAMGVITVMTASSAMTATLRTGDRDCRWVDSTGVVVRTNGERDFGRIVPPVLRCNE